MLATHTWAHSQGSLGAPPLASLAKETWFLKACSMHAKQSYHVGTRMFPLNLGDMLKQQMAWQKHKLQFPTEIPKSQETFWPSFLVGKRVQTFDELTLNLENIGKALRRNHGTNISTFYSSFPIVKQRYHWIFPLSNKPLHSCIEEIQVLLDGPRGQLKKISCEWSHNNPII